MREGHTNCQVMLCALRVVRGRTGLDLESLQAWGYRVFLPDPQPNSPILSSTLELHCG